jgi:lipoate-protein ligase A
MAVDDALLEACASGEAGFPCLRFYQWDPPCLSLGVHQDPARAVDEEALREMGIDLVRRPTGGRAVLHDVELTYAVVGPCRSGDLAGPVMTSYRRISEALVRGLTALGLEADLSAGDPPAGRASVEPCFARRSRCEIESRGEKLVGSVQLQRRGCLLQHGSIPLRLIPERLARATGGVAPVRAAGLEELLGRRVSPGELTGALADGFRDRFEAELTPGELSHGEECRVLDLEERRYRTAGWTRYPPRRRPSARE